MRILVAEDEKAIALQYKIVLESRKHKVVITYDGEECLNAYRNETKSSPTNQKPAFDVVVLDYRMPKMDGVEVAKEILALNSKQRIIFATASMKSTIVDSMKLLEQDVEMILKPFTLDSLVETVERKKSAQT